jgi:hypothetical protein
MKLAALSITALICLSFQPQIAHAQADILMMRLCKKITDDGARLKCFDAIGTEVAKTTEEKGPRPAPQWDVRESKSPVDDSPQIIAGIPSDDGKSRLILRCQEKQTEAAFFHDDLFVFKSGPVLLRVNDLPAATGTWTGADNNKAVFAPNGVTFVRMLPDNGTLFIRATGHSKSVDGSFQLGDVSAVRDRIATACKWNVAAPSAAAQPKKPATPKPSAPASEPTSLAPTR